tara:strand:- start:28482 stop:29051 length:570 start_codon:yes stop_codon:yes gene_type:complete
MSSIDLSLDNNNEITFQVNIEGSSPAHPSCRFLIEGQEMSFAFPGEIERDGTVNVTVPPLEKVLREGSYNSGLEVIVDDRVFVPLELEVNFEKSVRVTAEAVSRKKRPVRSASAQLIGTTVRKGGKSPTAGSLISETGSHPPVVKVVKPPPSQKREKLAERKNASKRDEVSMKDLSENQIRNLIRNMIK